MTEEYENEEEYETEYYENENSGDFLYPDLIETYKMYPEPYTSMGGDEEDYFADPTQKPVMMTAPPTTTMPPPQPTQQGFIDNLGDLGDNIGSGIQTVTPFQIPTINLGSPKEFAKTLIKWTALLAFMVWVFFSGKFGFTKAKTLIALMVCCLFAIINILVGTASGYKSGKKSCNCKKNY